MCFFCDKIYKSNEELANAQYESYESKDGYISDGIVKIDNCYNIVIPDADRDKSITDIKYCPYCGKQLNR